MTSIFGITANEILDDKQLLFTLSSTIMFLIFSYPPLVKVSTRTLSKIIGNVMGKTHIEMMVLFFYSLIFGLSVYIFSVHIFHKIINSIYNIRGALRMNANRAAPTSRNANRAAPTSRNANRAAANANRAAAHAHRVPPTANSAAANANSAAANANMPPLPPGINPNANNAATNANMTQGFKVGASRDGSPPTPQQRQDILDALATIQDGG